MNELDEVGYSLMRLTLHGVETHCIWTVMKPEELKMSSRFWVGRLAVWVKVTWLGMINSVMTVVNAENQSVWLL